MSQGLNQDPMVTNVHSVSKLVMDLSEALMLKWGLGVMKLRLVNLSQILSQNVGKYRYFWAWVYENQDF